MKKRWKMKIPKSQRYSFAFFSKFLFQKKRKTETKFSWLLRNEGLWEQEFPEKTCVKIVISLGRLFSFPNNYWVSNICYKSSYQKVVSQKRKAEIKKRKLKKSRGN